MVVNTHTERLVEYRKMILELLFAERNHVCAVCVMNGNCELQYQAAAAGMDHVRFDYLHPDLPIDASHRNFVIDHNRCILCTRCVRVCDEVEGAHVWDDHGPWRQQPHYQRLESAVGQQRQLYKLWQMCPGLPHRRAGNQRIHRGRNDQAP